MDERGPMNVGDDTPRQHDSDGASDETRDAPTPGGGEAERGTLDGGSSVASPDTVGSAPTVGSAGGAAPAVDFSIERPGQTIGRYKLLEQIGEGGFGIVYLAEQEQPVRRRVALKIIKLGMDTREVIARFEAERQALALMDHPHIAKVLDAGATQTGRPYFVMELVQGVPITEYCNRRKLPLRERLHLFSLVCGAVQHAHQKGIIHRDIKPSNVLVTFVDDKPAPKVIDFGIAKATQARLTEHTLFTELGQFIGTPAYMSPEQSDPIGADVDTRSDIYSLGVLLYELLTGTTPFDGKALRNAGLDEIKRIIREDEPPRPSTRLSRLGAELDAVARLRAIAPSRLRATLRGDLDWIVMKALEKDRRRRYETANGLAMDLERHLAGEPVVAAPPSASYRLHKFVKRNRTPVAAGGAVALALVLGVVGFAWQSAVARGQRDRALLAEEQTRRRANELDQVVDFQAQMLAQIDPTAAGIELTQDVRARFDAALAKAELSDEERTRQVEAFADQWSRVNATDAARELIDLTILRPAARAIDKQFADQPTVAATLRHKLAERYYGLGLFGAALALEQQALAERRCVLGDEHPDTLISVNTAGVYLSDLGRAEEAEASYRDAIEKTRRVLGDDHRDTLVCISNLGSLLLTGGRIAEAEPYVHEALDRRRRVLGDDDAETLDSVRLLGVLRKEQGRLDECEACYRQVLAGRRRALGETHPDTLSMMHDLGVLLNTRGKLDEATACFREVTALKRRVLGEAHPSTLRSMQGLGTVLDSSGRSEEAEALLREALASQRRLLGADHISTSATMGNLAVLLLRRNKLAEAEPIARETLERRTRVFGPSHNATLVANNVMGQVLIGQGRLAEGEPYWQEAAAIGRRVLGAAHPDTLVYVHNLGKLAALQDKPADAERHFREVIQTGGPAIGAGHPTVLSATQRLAVLLLKQERDREADELLSAAETAARATYSGAREVSLGAFLKDLGAARARREQFGLAETTLLEAHQILTRATSADPADTRACAQMLVDCYDAWHQAEPAGGHDAKAAEWRLKRDALNASAPASAP